jgi:hypothetical protein
VTRRARSLLPVALVLVTACSSISTLATREHGVITKAGRISVFDLRPGDCLFPDGVVAGDVEKVKAVPCREPHTHEVFAVPAYPGSARAYPGRSALERFAATACRSALRPYVGSAPLDPSLTLGYLVPSTDSWRRDSDRQVTCVLVTSGNKMAGSVRSTSTSAP